MPYFFIQKLSAVAQVGWCCCSNRHHTFVLLAVGCKIALPLHLPSSAGILPPLTLTRLSGSPLAHCICPGPQEGVRPCQRLSSAVGSGYVAPGC